ncbi:hypothetical protein [Rhizobium sp. RM]|uniref:hypothetical protein n=1 Tax=Rhizobium sp. RM TaxID=2748079 RepID=UPI00110E81CD|nr:hypothetical protein [Rhizobium sp. RM]NWJ23478.1 hypothetical protein [Rhizobium sp. RM]TMV19310.1 hypothetical protein BJG94_14540 [Rhizobium sp. Td3]
MRWNSKGKSISDFSPAPPATGWGGVPIWADQAELEARGNWREANTNTGTAGRPTKVIYLNEQQALLIAIFSCVEEAAAVYKLIIDVFMAWRWGAWS